MQKGALNFFIQQHLAILHSLFHIHIFFWSIPYNHWIYEV